MKYSKRNTQNRNNNRSYRVGGGIFNHSIKFTFEEKEYILLKKSFGRGYKLNDKFFSNLNKLIEYFKQNDKGNNQCITLFNTLIDKYLNEPNNFHFKQLLLMYNDWVDISMNSQLESYIIDIIQTIDNNSYSIQFLDRLTDYMTLTHMEHLYPKYIVHKRDIYMVNSQIHKNIRLYKKLLKLHESLEIYEFSNDIPLLLNSIYGPLPICKIEPKLRNISISYQKFIQSGSFGSVFKNETKSQAIKIIDTSKHSSLNHVINLMKREVYTYYKISSLKCNNNLFCSFINAYYDHNKHKIFVLMEYCGIDLFTVLYSGIIHQIPFKWFINIVKGVKCLHDNNYVHFDIKPENIVITNTVERRRKKRISKDWIFDHKRNESENESRSRSESGSGSESENENESGSESGSGSRRESESKRSRTNEDKFHISNNSSAKLIDFGLSYEISSISSKISPGTDGYRAPELEDEDKEVIDYKKCDIYSLGMTFGLCLYLTIYASNYDISIDDILTGRERHILIQLLEDINLHDMVDSNPNMRPDINTVITRLR
jgi:hypothetical protein